LVAAAVSRDAQQVDRFARVDIGAATGVGAAADTVRAVLVLGPANAANAARKNPRTGDRLLSRAKTTGAGRSSGPGVDRVDAMPRSA
jgi:hypothetical protein